jgi:hypothetical protein
MEAWRFVCAVGILLISKLRKEEQRELGNHSPVGCMEISIGQGLTSEMTFQSSNSIFLPENEQIVTSVFRGTETGMKPPQSVFR